MSGGQAERAGARITTRNARAVYPFLAEGGLGWRGCLIGNDSGGGAFCYDPWSLYEQGRLDDANLIVFGHLHQGKSALIKTLIWRMSVFGRRAFVLDVKSEYAGLCQLLGVTPIRLAPGGAVRLNPLSARREEHAQLEILRAIARTAVGRPLSPEEAGALREALRVIRAREEPTIPKLAELLFSPPADAADALRTTSETLAVQARAVALGLQDLCEGPLRGMFDGPTTPGLELDGRLVVLDLHAVKDSPALGILMACASSWLSALHERMADTPGAGRLISVADECWKIIEHEGLGDWFRANFKFARRYGVMNVIVLHKVADLLGAGDAGSRASKIAAGLISDSSTRVIYRQQASEITEAKALLGLGDREAEIITRLGVGQALWQVGARSFVVQHYRTRLERTISDTDQGMHASQ